MVRFLLAVAVLISLALTLPPQPPEADYLMKSQTLEGTLRLNEAELAKLRLCVSLVLCFLFGAFCALWAQNTGRSAWSWFLLGALFHIITVAVLLAKNSRDQRAGHLHSPTGPAS
jgi:hypothetical protein